MPRFLNVLLFTLLLLGCDSGGDGDNGPTTNSPTPPVITPPPVGNSKINGIVFDNAISNASVSAISAYKETIATDISDEDGLYQLEFTKLTSDQIIKLSAIKDGVVFYRFVSTTDLNNADVVISQLTSIEFAKADKNRDGFVDANEYANKVDITPTDLLVAAIVKYHVDSNSNEVTNQTDTYQWILSLLDDPESISDYANNIPDFDLLFTTMIEDPIMQLQLSEIASTTDTSTDTALGLIVQPTYSTYILDSQLPKDWVLGSTSVVELINGGSVDPSTFTIDVFSDRIEVGNVPDKLNDKAVLALNTYITPPSLNKMQYPVHISLNGDKDKYLSTLSLLLSSRKNDSDTPFAQGYKELNTTFKYKDKINDIESYRAYVELTKPDLTLTEASLSFFSQGAESNPALWETIYNDFSDNGIIDDKESWLELKTFLRDGILLEEVTGDEAHFARLSDHNNSYPNWLLLNTTTYSLKRKRNYYAFDEADQLSMTFEVDADGDIDAIIIPKSSLSDVPKDYTFQCINLHPSAAVPYGANLCLDEDPEVLEDAIKFDVSHIEMNCLYLEITGAPSECLPPPPVEDGSNDEELLRVEFPLDTMVFTEPDKEESDDEEDKKKKELVIDPKDDKCTIDTLNNNKKHCDKVTTKPLTTEKEYSEDQCFTVEGHKICTDFETQNKKSMAAWTINSSGYSFEYNHDLAFTYNLSITPEEDKSFGFHKNLIAFDLISKKPILWQDVDSPTVAAIIPQLLLFSALRLDGTGSIAGDASVTATSNGILIASSSSIEPLFKLVDTDLDFSAHLYAEVKALFQAEIGLSFGWGGNVKPNKKELEKNPDAKDKETFTQGRLATFLALGVRGSISGEVSVGSSDLEPFTADYSYGLEAFASANATAKVRLWILPEFNEKWEYDLWTRLLYFQASRNLTGTLENGELAADWRLGDLVENKNYEYITTAKLYDEKTTCYDSDLAPVETYTFEDGELSPSISDNIGTGNFEGVLCIDVLAIEKGKEGIREVRQQNPISIDFYDFEDANVYWISTLSDINSTSDVSQAILDATGATSPLESIDIINTQDKSIKTLKSEDYSIRGAYIIVTSKAVESYVNTGVYALQANYRGQVVTSDIFYLNKGKSTCVVAVEGYTMNKLTKKLNQKTNLLDYSCENDEKQNITSTVFLDKNQIGELNRNEASSAKYQTMGGRGGVIFNHRVGQDVNGKTLPPLVPESYIVGKRSVASSASCGSSYEWAYWNEDLTGVYNAGYNIQTTVATWTEESVDAAHRSNMQYKVTVDGVWLNISLKTNMKLFIPRGTLQLLSCDGTIIDTFPRCSATGSYDCHRDAPLVSTLKLNIAEIRTRSIGNDIKKLIESGGTLEANF